MGKVCSLFSLVWPDVVNSFQQKPEDPICIQAPQIPQNLGPERAAASAQTKFWLRGKLLAVATRILTGPTPKGSSPTKKTGKPKIHVWKEKKFFLPHLFLSWADRPSSVRERKFCWYFPFLLAQTSHISPQPNLHFLGAKSKHSGKRECQSSFFSFPASAELQRCNISKKMLIIF